MITECIVLAGGAGTRLRDTVPDLPKCMAPVAGHPFLYYVINSLRLQRIEKFIFSLGYKHEIIETYLKDHFSTLKYECVIEKKPLGTGGAIKAALKKSTSSDVLIANGDTLFNITKTELAAVHKKNNADCTLALKPMQQTERYGVVALNVDGSIHSFKEKQYYETGHINGGIYLLNKEKFLLHNWPEKFSFEKDYLETGNAKLSGSIHDGYFIDIGIPADYYKAQKDLLHPPFDLKKITTGWTLFLDRDGVINIDKEGSYIFSPEEFIFINGGPALFKKLSEKFHRIIIVTNQRGVGRGLMTEEMLKTIHEKMIVEINNAGGRIDGIYYCTSTNNDDPMRKPNPGMAVLAKNDFDDIDLSKSIMVGNNISDMHFGRNAGMYTVFVKTTQPQQPLPHPDIDLAVDTLADFAALI